MSRVPTIHTQNIRHPNSQPGEGDSTTVERPTTNIPRHQKTRRDREATSSSTTSGQREAHKTRRSNPWSPSGRIVRHTNITLQTLTHKKNVSVTGDNSRSGMRCNSQGKARARTGTMGRITRVGSCDALRTGSTGRVRHAASGGTRNSTSSQSTGTTSKGS
jgi:hypothetical protein